MTPEQIETAQLQLGRLAIDAARIDLDAFLKVANEVASPQALQAGVTANAVISAGFWADLARLLKPFWDYSMASVTDLQRIYGSADEEIASLGLGCPQCGENRVDELVIHDDETVHCLSCGNDYALPDGKEDEPA